VSVGRQITWTVECSRCHGDVEILEGDPGGGRGGHIHTTTDVVRLLRADGWRISRGDADVCPDCLAGQDNADDDETAR
jgi:hypothetical protein